MTDTNELRKLQSWLTGVKNNRSWHLDPKALADELDALRARLATTRRERDIALQWYRVHEELCIILGCQLDANPEYMLGQWRKSIDALRAEVAKLTAERDALRELVAMMPTGEWVMGATCDVWIAKRDAVLKGTDDAPSVD